MAIEEFQGEFRFLSNFFTCDVRFEDEVYPSAEHAYQAAKTLKRAERRKIRTTRTAGQAKKAGYRVTLRPDWEEVKLKKMEKIVLAKFMGNPRLQDKLIATGTEELIEGNWWGDTFWGVCRGKGENHLGKILMKVRKRCMKLRGKMDGK